MKCPYCKYCERTQEGLLKGSFYELPVKMERPCRGTSYPDEETLYGCPKCGKLFMDTFGELADLEKPIRNIK